MRRLPLFPLLGLLAGCSAGTQGTQANLPTSAPTFPPEVALANTIFLGDAITADWSYPPTGAKFGIVNCEFADFAGAYATICVSGCSPTGFQAILKASPNFQRVVILIGTFDALQTTACGGSGLDPGSVSDYGEVVKVAQSFGLQVFVGTIPFIDGASTGACAAAITALNQQIEAMAQQVGAYVVDYNSTLDTSADFAASATYAPLPGIVPSAAGYTIMESTYASATGGTP
jgi:hypothetical protein